MINQTTQTVEKQTAIIRFFSEVINKVSEYDKKYRLV